MTDFKKTSCGLCRKTVTDEDFQVIDSVIRDNLDSLLLKMEFHSDNKEIICSACRIRLNKASEFKEVCLNTDKMVIPYMDCEKILHLDLFDIYMKENGREHLTGISHSHKICRLCMQLIMGEIRCIGEEELEAINKLVPEMNMSVIKDPFICKPCFDSLCTHSIFLKDCSEAERNVGYIFESSATDTSSSDLCIKTEDLNRQFGIKDMVIKTECVYIKSEDGEESDALLPYSDKEAFENSDCKDAEDEWFKHMLKPSSRHIDNCDMKTIEKGSQFASNNALYKCDKCSYETRSTTCFMTHCGQHTNDSNVYKCETCKYVTKKKTLLKSHKLRHKNPSELQMYKCHTCDFESKYKHACIRHQLTHKDTSEIQMYSCNECNYESKYKGALARHILQHKSTSHMLMYKCDKCIYETRSKTCFMTHCGEHKNDSIMYKCESCEYTTKKKTVLKYHKLKHKNPSEMQMYRCDACDYESIYKPNFIRHQLTHKDPSEIQMYSCNKCNYESKYKNALARHMLQHKNLSQVQMYKCDVCGYESRYKSNLYVHQLIHTDSSKVQKYRCNKCNYKTKNKTAFASHEVEHKDSSQMQMYKCDACDFESRYGRGLTEHQFRHKQLSKVQKVDNCDYRTKLKLKNRSHVDVCQSALFNKTENLDRESGINDMEVPIKIECVDIKLEGGGGK